MFINANEGLNMEILVKKEKIEAYENDKCLGFLKYSLENNILTIISTVVYEDARGKGVAKELNRYIFDYVKKGINEIRIICSYSKNYYLKNKDQYNDVKVVLIEEDNNVCSI